MDSAYQNGFRWFIFQTEGFRLKPWHRKYSQSEYRNTIVYSSVFNWIFPPCTVLIPRACVFSLLDLWETSLWKTAAIWPETGQTWHFLVLLHHSSQRQVKKAREGNERKKRERKKQRVAILVLIMATLKKKLNENRLFKCGNLFANPVRYVYIPRNIVIFTYNFFEYTLAY